MADIQGGTGFNDLAVARKSRCQELPELFGGHPVTTDLEPLFGVAFVIDVIGRIDENQIHKLRRHEVFYVGSKGGVSAKHAMISEHPHIARNGNLDLRQFRNRILIGEPVRRFLLGEQSRQVLVFKAGHMNVEVLFFKRRQFEPQ
jgi:hypothetical protein